MATVKYFIIELVTRASGVKHYYEVLEEIVKQAKREVDLQLSV